MKVFSILATLFVLIVANCSAQTKDIESLKKVSWIFAEKDFNSDIKEEKVEKGNHTSEIIRQASTEKDKALIKKAEALYPEESDEIKNKDYSPANEEKPYWSGNSFDGVKIASVISTRAIIYYQEISQAFRSGKKVTKIKMSKTNFNYNANVQHYDQFKVAGENFDDVSVVRLKMEWSQFCGSLCAMGFNIGKVIVFNKEDEPIALFVDYGSGWIS